MRKKIAILGSTGSIGKNLIDIINKNKKDFEIVLLSTDSNYKELLKQAKQFGVKNLIINDLKSFLLVKKKNFLKNRKIYNNFNHLNRIFKKKIYYTMSSISGIDGLKPTIEMIKYSNNIAIANKESIICGWNLIDKQLKKNKTNFIPVDSEHFSIWYGLREINKNLVEKIYLTASGGPFLKTPISKLKSIKVKEAINHPNWQMGKKISIDSATMMNKIFEIIEAKNIFDIHYSKLSILIHPKSYVHAILKLKNGITKIIVHDTNMKIPIFNSLYFSNNQIKSKNIDLEILNNLNFKKINFKRFPVLKILDSLPKKQSLFETIIVSANDKLVELFLRKKIKFLDINKYLLKIIKFKEFKKYSKKRPRNIQDIINLNYYVRSKVENLIYK